MLKDFSCPRLRHLVQMITDCTTRERTTSVTMHRHNCFTDLRTGDFAGEWLVTNRNREADKQSLRTVDSRSVSFRKLETIENMTENLS